MHTHNTSLTEGPITKSLVRYAVPLLLSNLFQQLYNAVDSAVLGTFSGDTALAAAGSSGSLINVLIGFFLGLATGTGVLYAVRYGAKDYERLKKLVDTSLILSVIAAVFITVVGIAFTEQFLIWTDTPDDVLPLSKTYLQIYLSGTVITMVYNVGAGMLRAEGDSKRPLYYLIAGGVTNLILDLILVAVFDMGVAGAAIATVIAQGVSAVFTVARLMKLAPEYRLRPLKMKLCRDTSLELIRVSIPCGIQGSMFNIANLLVQAKINTFGSVAMAGVTAYTKIDGFIYMPTMAFSLAISTYVGQNIGAGKFDRVKRGIGICLIMAAAVGLFDGSLVIIFSRQLLSLFTDEPAVIDVARQMMWFMAPFAWTFTVSDILGGGIRGSGETVKVTMISAMCICVFRVAWLLIMLRFINDIRIVFACYPISWTLSNIVMVIYYFKGSWFKRACGTADTLTE